MEGELAVNDGPVVIAGGSGFLGTSLATELTSTGISVIVLSRTKPVANFPWQHVEWDARSVGKWISALNGARALVNLTGRSVDCIKD